MSTNAVGEQPSIPLIWGVIWGGLRAAPPKEKEKKEKKKKER